MIKKTLIILLFFMCISTNPLAQAACTCGSNPDSTLMAECTDLFIIVSLSNINSLRISCYAFAIDDYDLCMQIFTEEVCDPIRNEDYLRCEDDFDEYLERKEAEWRECKASACS